MSEPLPTSSSPITAVGFAESHPQDATVSSGFSNRNDTLISSPETSRDLIDQLSLQYEELENKTGVYSIPTTLDHYKLLGLSSRSDDMEKIRSRLSKIGTTYDQKNYSEIYLGAKKLQAAIDNLRSRVKVQDKSTQQLSQWSWNIHCSFPNPQESREQLEQIRARINLVKSTLLNPRSKSLLDINLHNDQPIEKQEQSSDSQVFLAQTRGTKKESGYISLKQVCEDTVSFAESKSGAKAFMIADGVTTRKGSFMAKALEKAFDKIALSYIDGLTQDN